mmetsp:Transcript_28868/g.74049  ORF Transcript_28868/g.74049 Transcript_28868/m.74049 type:complete len:257 (+) Transcript_28868:3871-4641(+)
MPHTQLGHNISGKHTRGKGTTEDVRKLLVQTTDTHGGEGEVRTEDLRAGLRLFDICQFECGRLCFDKVDGGVGNQNTSIDRRRLLSLCVSLLFSEGGHGESLDRAHSELQVHTEVVDHDDLTSGEHVVAKHTFDVLGQSLAINFDIHRSCCVYSKRDLTNGELVRWRHKSGNADGSVHCCPNASSLERVERNRACRYLLVCLCYVHHRVTLEVSTTFWGEELTSFCGIDKYLVREGKRLVRARTCKKRKRCHFEPT